MGQRGGIDRAHFNALLMQGVDAIPCRSTALWASAAASTADIAIHADAAHVTRVFAQFHSSLIAGALPCGSAWQH